MSHIESLALFSYPVRLSINGFGYFLFGHKKGQGLPSKNE